MNVAGPVSVSLINGLNVKNSCRLVTVASLAAYTYANGALGIGATITETGLGKLTVDSVDAVVGDRILVKNGAAGADNGIYTVTATGSAGASFILTRATDYNQTNEIQEGDFVLVEEGTTSAASGWVMTSSGAITVGTTTITWTQFSAGGAPPTGAAGGDLTGTYPNPTIGAGKVTLADMANLTPPKLIGRGTASAGVPEALTPTNLYFGNGTVMAPSATFKQNGGYIAQSHDIMMGTAGSVTLSAATVNFTKVPLPGSGTTVYSITNVLAFLNTKATSTLTHSFAGLLTSAGVLVGITADESSANANWSSTGANGLCTMPLLSGPFNVTPTGIDDFVYVVLYIGTTAGTAPKFQANVPGVNLGAPAANVGTTAATSRTGTLGVADTATPFTGLTMSSITANANLVWAAVS